MVFNQGKGASQEPEVATDYTDYMDESERMAWHTTASKVSV